MSGPTRVGEVLAGKYELLERLGAGGMGDVYVARHRLLDRRVAIKLLHPELAGDQAMVHRLLREARAASEVRHPHIVEVLDVDREPGGVPFIVQELLEGRDLGHYLRELGDGVPAELALRLLVPVVDAIAAAHARGIVHRDVKPENVFLAKRDGAIVPKVLDFGLAKSLEGGVRLTATDVVMGTPAYMSPEQISSPEAIGPASDVWSLGVLFYETLTGRLPFEAEGVHALLLAITSGTPIPIASVAPEVPRDLARIVMKTLRHEPSARPTDGAALLVELARLDEDLRGPMTSSEAPPSPTARTLRAVAPPADRRGAAPPRGAATRAVRKPRASDAVTLAAAAKGAERGAIAERMPEEDSGERQGRSSVDGAAPREPRGAAASEASASIEAARLAPAPRPAPERAPRRDQTPLELAHVPRRRTSRDPPRPSRSLASVDWRDVGLATLLVAIAEGGLLATAPAGVALIAQWQAPFWPLVAIAVVLSACAALAWSQGMRRDGGVLGAWPPSIGLAGLAVLGVVSALAPHDARAAAMAASMDGFASILAALVPGGLAVLAAQRARLEHTRGAGAPATAYGVLMLLAVATAFAIGRVGDRLLELAA